MKSFFITLIFTLSLLLSVTSAHAAPYTLNAIRTDKTITVTMQGAPVDQTLYQLYDSTNAIQAPKAAKDGIVQWKLVDEFKDNYLYTFRVTRPNTIGLPKELDVTEKVYLTVGTVSSISPLNNLKIVPGGSGKVIVSGNVGSSARNDVTVTFLWSQTGTADKGPTNAKPLSAGVGGQFPIAEDGTYSITVPNLDPAASYYFKLEIAVKGSSTPFDAKVGTFTTEKGYLIPGSVGETLDFNSRSYHLLAPWPGLSVLMDPDLCLEMKKGPNPKIPMNAICDVNGFLDFAFKLMIGLAAVVLVLRLMYEGYVILTTDVPFLQASAKGNFKTALLGLLLALSSYVILNTINPKLVNNTISIDSVAVGVQDFILSGSVTFDGKPIKVNFKKEAYPAAKKASEKTGVDTAFILAMFAQESGSGQESGTCNYINANMGSGQIDKLKQVAILLGMDYTKINMSCSGGGSSHGGAIGYTQFLPGTWLEYNAQAKTILGHEPNPWNVEDTIMMTALFLKNKGGVGTDQASQEKAACSYFGTCTKNGQSLLINCGKEKKTYGQCVLGKKISIQEQIDKAKASGEIK